MKNIAIINACALSPYAHQSLPNGRSAFRMVLDFCRTLPEVEQIVCFANRTLPKEDGYRLIERGDWNVQGLLGSMDELAGGYGNIFYMYGDCPLLSMEVAVRMYNNHLKYFSDYSFADGYPYGVAPEILNTRSLQAIRRLAGEGNGPVERETLFDVIKKDINAFNVETDISPKDLRLLRVSLTADRKRNFLLLESLMQLKTLDVKSILGTIQDSPEKLRTLPSFFNFQVVEGCPQNCSYCPYPQMRNPSIGKQGEMDLDSFRKIVKQIKEYCEDGVLSVSLWGEPAFYSRPAELVDAVLDSSPLEMIIETAGIGWDRKVLEQIAEKALRGLRWIVSLDAWEEPVYKRLRGEGFRESVETAEVLDRLFPGRVYVQAVRMKENEEDLEKFYRGWKKRTENLIIQKYDHFCMKLQDRRVTDLSPLKRFPCWHLKRDMVILMDGRVPMCREDLEGVNILGNIREDGIEQVWERGCALYEGHIRQDYPTICTHCDEYYTYNF